MAASEYSLILCSASLDVTFHLAVCKVKDMRGSTWRKAPHKTAIHWFCQHVQNLKDKYREFVLNTVKYKSSKITDEVDHSSSILKGRNTQVLKKGQRTISVMAVKPFQKTPMSEIWVLEKWVEDEEIFV